MQITYLHWLHLENTPGCSWGGKWQSLHHKAKPISIYTITLATARKSLLFPKQSVNQCYTPSIRSCCGRAFSMCFFWMYLIRSPEIMPACLDGFLTAWLVSGLSLAAGSDLEFAPLDEGFLPFSWWCLLPYPCLVQNRLLLFAWEMVTAGCKLNWHSQGELVGFFCPRRWTELQNSLEFFRSSLC